MNRPIATFAVSPAPSTKTPKEEENKTEEAFADAVESSEPAQTMVASGEASTRGNTSMNDTFNASMHTANEVSLDQTAITANESFSEVRPATAAKFARNTINDEDSNVE